MNDSTGIPVLDSAITAAKEAVSKLTTSASSTYKFSTMSDKQKKLEDMIKALRDRSDFTTFIYFHVNDLTLDTRVTSPNNLQYIVSMTNEKNGSGLANKFTLTATFTNYDTKAIKDFEDSFINYSGSSEDKNLCQLQYGYIRTINGEEELSSPLYEGRLLDFKMSIRDNFITYTFTGYSGLRVEQDIQVQWYPGPKILTESAVDKVTYQGYIQNLMIGGDPLVILNSFLNEISEFPGAFKYHLVILDPEIAERNALSRIAVSPCNGRSPITYINYLLSMFKFNEKQARDSWINRLTGITPTVSYTVEMTGKDDYTITLYLRKKREPIAEFSLNSGNPRTNDMLIDFNVEVDGAVVLALDQSERFKVKTSQVILANGKVVSVASVFNTIARSARTSINQNVFSSNIKSNKFDFAQTGDATLIGVPAEIPISSTVRLNSYINNELHRISGDFFVESVVDSISTGGFFTTKIQCLRLEDQTDNLIFNTKGS